MLDGTRPFLFEVQALVSSAVYGTAQRSATGFDTRRLNMLLAVLERRAGFKLGQKDVFLNMHDLRAGRYHRLIIGGGMLQGLVDSAGARHGCQ